MIELLREATGAEHIFLLFAGSAGPGFKPGLGDIEDLPDGERVRQAARRLRIRVTPVNFTKHEDFEPAFRVISSTPKSAAIVHLSVHWFRITSAHRSLDWYVHKHRVVVMMPGPDWVQSNTTSVIGYGKGMLEEKERYSYFVDRILRGAKPADLPFEHLPYRLGIGLDAAKLYGITIPASLMLKADIVVPPHPRFKWIEPPPGPVGLEP
jgi:putative ABC transport system substrate-binding protein